MGQISLRDLIGGSMFPLHTIIPNPYIKSFAPQPQEIAPLEESENDTPVEESSTYIGKEDAQKIYDELGYTFDREEFFAGINVELEHKDVTDGDLKKTAMIAAAHLREVPDYYTLLKKYVEK